MIKSSKKQSWLGP